MFKFEKSVFTIPSGVVGKSVIYQNNENQYVVKFELVNQTKLEKLAKSNGVDLEDIQDEINELFDGLEDFVCHYGKVLNINTSYDEKDNLEFIFENKDIDKETVFKITQLGFNTVSSDRLDSYEKFDFYEIDD